MMSGKLALDCMQKACILRDTKQAALNCRERSRFAHYIALRHTRPNFSKTLVNAKDMWYNGL